MVLSLPKDIVPKLARGTGPEVVANLSTKHSPAFRAGDGLVPTPEEVLPVVTSLILYVKTFAEKVTLSEMICPALIVSGGDSVTGAAAAYDADVAP